MFYNVRLFLYTKLHVEMCLINFGIRYECKIGVRFVKEFNDTIRQNPFCRRILILKHKLRIEDAGACKWEYSLRKDFTTFCMPSFSSVITIFFCQFSLFFLDCLLVGDFWYGFRLVISPLCSTKFFLLKYAFWDKKITRPPTVHCVAMLSEHEFLVFESHVQYP